MPGSEYRDIRGTGQNIVFTLIEGGSILRSSHSTEQENAKPSARNASLEMHLIEFGLLGEITSITFNQTE